MFTVLVHKRPELKQKIRDCVVPISGDLNLQGLGLEPKIKQELIEDLDIIINSAASVYFTDPLMDLLKTNYVGTV